MSSKWCADGCGSTWVRGRLAVLSCASGVAADDSVPPPGRACGRSELSEVRHQGLETWSICAMRPCRRRRMLLPSRGYGTFTRRHGIALCPLARSGPATLSGPLCALLSDRSGGAGFRVPPIPSRCSAAFVAPRRSTSHPRCDGARVPVARCPCGRGRIVAYPPKYKPPRGTVPGHADRWNPGAAAGIESQTCTPVPCTVRAFQDVRSRAVSG